MIDGNTLLFPLFGYPTYAFKAPLIYNPWFAAHNINAKVVPLGATPENFPEVFKAAFKTSNIPGALITMPHKVAVVELLDEVSVAVKVAGSCNAVYKTESGKLIGDMFDGTGFCRGLANKGFCFTNARCLLVGSGGVGAAIAASLAAEGIAALTICDLDTVSANALAKRLQEHYPNLDAKTGGNKAAGYDLVINATPLGLPGDPLPMDVDGMDNKTFVGEVVMKQEITPLLAIAKERGCNYQIGTDMLFEMIPAYLEFFKLGTTTAAELRSLAHVTY